MKIGIPKEILPGENRVALIPDSVKKLKEQGLEIVLESGAGAGSNHSDEDYAGCGAEIASSHQAVLGGADLIVKVMPPATGGDDGPDEVSQMKEGAALIGLLQPFNRRGMLEKLAARNLTAMSMEMVPRISRAQNMDVLSSMATVGGYKAVLMAANAFQRFFPMFMTAAGTIAPARVLILGAGVAGLQAIATAKRLGAVVEAFDTRPVVKGEVESLGAKFIALDASHEEAQDAGGYAKELSEAHHRKELELIASRMARTDIIITTAQIPGKKAPVLITEAMVKSLKPGSVILDMAVEGGGNCELTEYDTTVVKHGVTLIGKTNLPSLMPVHASQMYSRNILNLIDHLMGEDGLQFDMEDPITAGVVVTQGGSIVHPALRGGEG
ncbi:MAG: Re/Si-specific NAD(P)(+) transhydrogenase subunit alpha [SAR324 cluster bacterium]|nr:Re/Si-specific NAD(P)(+) transhydrogenase subunit alpha [SAR324 cluster bacterium]